MIDPTRRRRARNLTLAAETHTALDSRPGDASRWIDSLVAAELVRERARARRENQLLSVGGDATR